MNPLLSHICCTIICEMEETHFLHLCRAQGSFQPPRGSAHLPSLQKRTPRIKSAPSAYHPQKTQRCHLKQREDISYINEDVGFRPIFEILGPDILVPDGTILTVGTLYMNGQPLRVPQVPVYSGDIPNYIPGAKLKIENPLEDPAYQIRAIKIGRILAADRVLLKKISWEDLECQRFC